MLFEQRIYTLVPGALDAFWQAQQDRGFELVQPILDRLVGYFSAESGPGDQVVHLYRYDSYDDWVKRLHGLYGVAALEPYFTRVRSLMLAQENKFLALAPLPELAPCWSGGNDWHPADGPIFPLAQGEAAAMRDVVLDETTTVLRPGSLPAYWQAYREHGLHCRVESAGGLLGCFVSLVGRQHQVVHYRWHPDFAEREAFRCARLCDDNWQAFLAAIAPLVVCNARKVLRPAPIAELSPAFVRAR
ncbi:hypothetical protein LMG23992_00840 [Cupriavidus laharis]|uniref:NIPSNAP domain-containing protein n=1 Tax=Cupriavidus laharis TaxID=151654 RepID=A0ABM8WK42_9BURK|nr:NIPSNAP family protein [Cupriavidus laharis]CAG9167562.1 hypothetical protein LMG23992_00840 [Cupriavidus laharis]